GQASAAERRAHAVSRARADASGRLHALELSGLSGEYEINLTVDRRSNREVDARVRACARHGGLGEEGLDVALSSRPSRARLVVRVARVEDGAACLRGAYAELGVVAVGASFGRGAPLARGLKVEAVDEFGGGRDLHGGECGGREAVGERAD